MYQILTSSECCCWCTYEGILETNGIQQLDSPHCKENPIYVFLFWELRGLSPNFHSHVSVRNSYIPRIGPHISLQQSRQANPGNI
jgi:hypothetical protein